MRPGTRARHFTPDIHNATGHDRVVDARQVNPEIPESLAQIILRCCEFSPSDRYQTTSELRLVLERFVSGKQGDRRKNPRPSVTKFKAIFRKKYLVSIAFGVLILACLLTINPPYKSRAEVDSGGLNLIEHLAEDPEKHVRSYLRKVTIDSIEDASKELRLSDAETNELVGSIDSFLTKLKDEENPNAFIEEAISNYRDSNLALATRIMGLNGIYENSSLDATTQEKAGKLIRQLAIAVTNQQIPEAEAQTLVASLTDGRDLTMKATKSLRYNRQQLTDWLLLVETRLNGITVGQIGLRKDLEKILGPPTKPTKNEASNTKSSGKQVQSMQRRQSPKTSAPEDFQGSD